MLSWTKPKVSDQRIPNRLRELRMKALLSQKQLAELSGLSQWTVSKIEHDHKVPHLINAHLLARALSVSIEDIFFPNSISILPISQQPESRPSEAAQSEMHP